MVTQKSWFCVLGSTAQFPIDPDLARLCDEGEIERYDSEALHNFADAFLKAISLRVK